MRLAARRAEAMWIGTPVGQCIGMVDLDLLPGEALPGAITELGEPPVVVPFAGIEAKLAPDDQRGLAGTAERASEKNRRPGLAFKFGAERLAHRLRLGPAARGEFGISGALHAALEIPGGLAVA